MHSSLIALRAPHGLRAQSLILIGALLFASCSKPQAQGIGLSLASGKMLFSRLESGMAGAAQGRLGVGFSSFVFPPQEGLNQEGRLELEYSTQAMGKAELEIEFLPSGEGCASPQSYPLPLSPRSVILSLPLAAGMSLSRLAFRLEGPGAQLRVHRLSILPDDDFVGYEKRGDILRLSPALRIEAPQDGLQTLSIPLESGGLGIAELVFAQGQSGSTQAWISAPGLGSGIRLEPGPLSGPLSLPFRQSRGGEVSLSMKDISALLSLRLRRAGPGPLPADPSRILAWTEADFRHPGYEIFSWDAHPELLILLFRDYALQDDFLKRLAFYVEKDGFRGRLAPNEQIAPLHGWNAHDYRARDLARFFNQAEEEGFTLNPEELVLRGLLEEEGVIRASGASWLEGRGALLSVSLETGPNMRRRFLVHECVHGLYFTNPEFRARAAELWEGAESELKDYVLEFFDFKKYDLEDSDLMVNEFTGYFLQSPADELADYFALTVSGFLDQDRKGGGRYRSFGQSRKSGFRNLALKLDASFYELFGLNGGRVWRAF